MIAEKVLAFRPREIRPDSLKQQPPPPDAPGRLVVFPTRDIALDSLLMWAARTNLQQFLRSRQQPWEKGHAAGPSHGDDD